MPILRRPLAGLLLAAGAQDAGAQLQYSLEVALGYSDNIGQAPVDEQGSAILIPRLDFDYNEQGAQFRARAVGQVEYRDYLDGPYANELRGQLSGVATWIVLPRRLSFDFEDYAAVQPVDVLAPNSPANQQQTNVFTLGPTFDFHLQPTLNGEAQVRLSDATASESKEFDSERALAALRLIKELTALDILSANVEYENVHFTDRTGGPDYERADAYARYQSKLAQLDLDLTLGCTRLDFSGADSRSGALARGLATWHATPNQTLAIGASRQITDAAQDLASDPNALLVAPGTAIVSGSLPVTSQVYLEKRVDLSYAFQSVRFGFRVAPYYRTLDYLIDPTFDQTARGAVVGVSYRPRVLWTLAFDAADERRSYWFFDRRDEDRRYDLSFTDQLTRQVSLRLDLIRNERRSTQEDQRFRENVAFVTLIYRR